MNLFLFAMGRLHVDLPPIISPDATGYTDPLPQALVLTAIVISFGMTALIVVLALRGFLRRHRPRYGPCAGCRRGRGHRSMSGIVASHWVVAPVILPAFVAAFLILVLRHSLAYQRIVSIAATALPLAIAIRNFSVAGEGPAQPYMLGAWPGLWHRAGAGPAVGHMVLLACVLALAVIVYAATGWDTRGRHFHPLFQFQLMGVNGAFLTGDVFNLFVFFEVMLIASYGLMLHGGGPRRLVAGFHYVAINLVGSTLFLFAVGVIYAVTGTLNMADLAMKVAVVAPAYRALLATGGLLLLMVFCLKAALVPLHWWLPTAYAARERSRCSFVHDHDEGRRVFHHPHLDVDFRCFGRTDGRSRRALDRAGRAGDFSCWRNRCTCQPHARRSGLLFDGLVDGLASGRGRPVRSRQPHGCALLYLAQHPRRGRPVPADRSRAGTSRTLARRAQGLAADRAARPACGPLLHRRYRDCRAPPAIRLHRQGAHLDATRGSAWAIWIWSIVLGTSLYVLLGLARAGSVVFSEERGGRPSAIPDEPGAGSA